MLMSIVGVIGGIVGVASFIMTLWDRHQRGLKEMQRGARGVSGHWDRTSNLLLVRNDGPLPVTLTNARFIPGRQVFPRSDITDLKPLETDSVRLPGSRFLRPGEELAFPCERRTFGAGEVGNHSTLVVSFTDHHGQPWEACEGEILKGLTWSLDSWRFRRQFWLERRSWMKPIEMTLMRWAVLEASRRPTGPLRWARFLDWFYGWRIGTSGPSFPTGQPQIWRYGDLQFMSTEPELSDVRAWRPFREWRAEQRLGPGAPVGDQPGVTAEQRKGPLASASEPAPGLVDEASGGHSEYPSHLSQDTSQTAPEETA